MLDAVVHATNGKRRRRRQGHVGDVDERPGPARDALDEYDEAVHHCLEQEHGQIRARHCCCKRHEQESWNYYRVMALSSTLCKCLLKIVVVFW